MEKPFINFPPHHGGGKATHDGLEMIFPGWVRRKEARLGVEEEQWRRIDCIASFSRSMPVTLRSLSAEPCERAPN